MRTTDLVKPIDTMSDEELLSYLREVRSRREIERPVAKRKQAVAQKKASRVRVDKTEDLLLSLTPEERQALINQLGG